MLKKRKKNCRKTLFLSGLKNSVKKNDILEHFIGSIKVTFKQSKTNENLK
jgi:RNA recognition motif-containing protein